MPPSSPARHRRRVLLLLAGVATAACLRGQAAQRAAGGNIAVSLQKNVRINIKGGTMQGDGVEVTQAPDTLVRGDQGSASGVIDGHYDNSRWLLNGHVHIEYQGMTLEAQSATVVFADQRIENIEVHGAPAEFTRPGRADGEAMHGRAAVIYFDGQKRLVRFAPPVWVSMGSGYEGDSAKPMVYNLDTTDLFSEGTDDSRINFTYSPDKTAGKQAPPPDKPANKHVPAPRSPSRGSAR